MRRGVGVITISYDYSTIGDEYKDVAFYYAKDVVDGARIAGKKVIKACIRHLNDLKKINLAPIFVQVLHN